MLQQLFWLFILPLPIACIARTIGSEELFKEFREHCKKYSKECASPVTRKLFYLFTCDYCLSHWITLAFICMTSFKLLLDDWRGYVISFFSVVFVANIYINLFAHIKVEITKVKEETEQIKSDTAASSERG